MIFSLPIAGQPLCLNTDSAGWQAQMTDMIGMAPSDNKGKNIAAGAEYTWITDHFKNCPIQKFLAPRIQLVVYKQFVVQVCETTFGESNAYFFKIIGQLLFSTCPKEVCTKVPHTPSMMQRRMAGNFNLHRIKNSLVPIRDDTYFSFNG